MSEYVTIIDIADMHKCSTKHAREVLVKTPGFPPEAPASSRRRRLWSAMEVHNFLHRRPLDEPGSFHLYRHFDATGTLLYVGVSLSAVARLGEHSRTAHWFNRIARIDVTRFHSREASLEAERVAIQTEAPLHNVQHSRPRA